MGPSWSPSVADRTQVGPMLVPWTLLSGWSFAGTKHEKFTTNPLKAMIFKSTDINWFWIVHCIWSLKRKCYHFNELSATGCTGSYHFENFRCWYWRKRCQNYDSSVSVMHTPFNLKIRSWSIVQYFLWFSKTQIFLMCIVMMYLKSILKYYWSPYPMKLWSLSEACRAKVDIKNISSLIPLK